MVRGCSGTKAIFCWAGPSSASAAAPPTAKNSKAKTNRSEEHTSELQSHSFISYAVFCLKNKSRRPWCVDLHPLPRAAVTQSSSRARQSRADGAAHGAPPAWHLSLRRRLLAFFFNDTATTEIYALSLHDALPILFERAFSTAAGCLIEVKAFNYLQRREIGRAQRLNSSHIPLSRMPSSA